MEFEDWHLKAQATEPRPVAFEALWDGDTQGWFLELIAVVETDEGFRARGLKCFYDPAEAAAAGELLAKEFGVPFYYPSPNHPEDECPHWWEQEQASPCGRCGIPLLQRAPCPWAGHCYHCHLALEREAKEAAMTPEERAAPKCEICGKPAFGEPGPHGRCQNCRDAYVDYECSLCGGRVMVPRGADKKERCSPCSLKLTAKALAPEERAAILAADAQGPLDGIIMARKVSGFDIHDAQVIVRLLKGLECFGERNDE